MHRFLTWAQPVSVREARDQGPLGLVTVLPYYSEGTRLLQVSGGHTCGEIKRVLRAFLRLQMLSYLMFIGPKWGGIH